MDTTASQTDSAIFSGNRSSDYQPSTSDPQNNVGGNLQPNNTNLQPVNGQSSLPQAQLNVNQTLTVETAQSSSDSRVSVQPHVDAGSNWPLIFLVFALAIIGVVIAFKKYWLPARTIAPAKSEEAPHLQEAGPDIEATPEPKLAKKAKKPVGKKKQSRSKRKARKT